MNKNILITGGLGYVGGRIAEFLSSNTDYNLIVADITDKVITPHDWIKKGNILNLDITSSLEVSPAGSNFTALPNS